MKSQRRSKSIATALLFVALSAGLLIAQDQDNAPAPPPPANVPVQQADQGAPQQYPGSPEGGGVAGSGAEDPSGRVARVQYMSGQVSIQPGGVNDWIAASTNRPLTSADRIWTDKESRAELNVGDGFIRMNSETSLTLTNVSDGTVQVELDQGILSLTVRHLAPGEIYEVDTPNYAFTVMKSGVYRFDVYPSEDQSWVTVRSGYGEATGRGNAVRVNSGTQVRFTSGNSLQHTAENAPARDGFDDWVQVRDKRLDNSVSARYVSPGVIGYQDLDAYGRWEPTPAYGEVWVPYSVAPGWAPYRFGHWVWIAPWGWTWVDDAPWGFAPFHYGRWVDWGGGWAWAPGPLGYWNPYYAPALVGWIGGPGFGIGFGFGSGWGIGVNFGWFPLGWGEPFFPRYAGWGHGGWYRGGGWVSNNYFRNVNVTNTHITNITNITNNYRNGNVNAARYGFRNRPGAVTAAPGSAFTSGAAINRVGGAVPKADLGKGAMLRGVDVNPTRQSVLGGHTPQTRGVPPASAFGRSVVTSNRGPAIRPANLETANQATLARGNPSALGRGNANNTPGAVNNAPHSPASAANNNGRVNGAGGNPGATQGRGAASTGAEARNNTPTSMGGRYVPRPPSAGGIPASGMRSGANNGAGAPTQTGRPNGSYSSAGRPTVSAPGAANGDERHGTTNPTVPRPPQTYQPGRQATTQPERTIPSRGTAPSAPAPRQSAPSSSGSKETPHGESQRGPGASLSAPHPPAGYSYRPAPAYSASAGSQANRPLGGNYAGGSRSSYTPSRSYSPGRSTGSYSAPRSSGSGGSFHAPSGMGSHSGGGGGSHASSGGGGGHHGR